MHNENYPYFIFSCRISSMCTGTLLLRPLSLALLQAAAQDTRAIVSSFKMCAYRTAYSVYRTERSCWSVATIYTLYIYFCSKERPETYKIHCLGSILALLCSEKERWGIYFFHVWPYFLTQTHFGCMHACVSFLLCLCLFDTLTLTLGCDRLSSAASFISILVLCCVSSPL